ncbi:MAG: mechanosensitive ion channel family protein [Phycisphaerales bacterium]|nr:mechanosensitive ion channel family protein [Phycisphaerales bacterium]
MSDPITLISEWSSLDREVVVKILYSAAALLLMLLVRFITLRLIRKHVDDTKAKYRWGRAINYLVGVLCLLLVARIWTPGLQNIGVFLGLASAGLAIALRDPIVCLVGWAFILIRRPYQVGDRIQIGDARGDVIDIRMFQTYLMECGEWIDGDQSTGRILLIPNNSVFSSATANYTHGFEYIWDEVVVRLTFESDWRRAKELLTQIANTHMNPHCDDAQRQIRSAASEHMIFFQKLTPIVYTSVREWGVQLTVRYLTPPRQRRGSAQRLWEAILDAFAGEPDIRFAYPTTRFARGGGPEERAVPEPGPS